MSAALLKHAKPLDTLSRGADDQGPALLRCWPLVFPTFCFYYRKMARAGFHVTKSEVVDAPIIDELPMTLECKLISFDEESELLLGESVNVSADERILDSEGKIDPQKLQPISFDPVHNDYLVLGKKIGNAFEDGKKLK